MEAGAIPFLINMLPSQLLDECSAASSDAAATLMHLASNGACCVAIHSDGGVPRLLEALGTPCMLHAGITLQNLASHVVGLPASQKRFHATCPAHLHARRRLLLNGGRCWSGFVSSVTTMPQPRSLWRCGCLGLHLQCTQYLEHD